MLDHPLRAIVLTTPEFDPTTPGWVWENYNLRVCSYPLPTRFSPDLSRAYLVLRFDASANPMGTLLFLALKFLVWNVPVVQGLM